MLSFGGWRRGRTRGCVRVARVRRRGTAAAATAQRQRQPVDAADTSPRHHSPSLLQTVQTYLLQCTKFDKVCQLSF